MSILSLKNINKTYESKKANDDISLSVEEGEIFGLLGPNGAGKTTLIRIITNIIAPDSGTVLFQGKPMKESFQQHIGYMPEERGLYRKMKVGEHLLYLAQLKSLSKQDAKEKISVWMERFSIADWWNKRVEELSKGMQQKIQFIATVLHDPPLLILDEPFSGLDPINSNLIKDEIYNLKKKGTAIIFSTHRMEQVEEICEDIALINDGKNILTGNIKDIQERFKKHQYSITFSGKLPEPNDILKVISHEGNEIIIQLEENETPNKALEYCIQHKMEVTAFHEIRPTINQIFIDQVSKQTT